MEIKIIIELLFLSIVVWIVVYQTERSFKNRERKIVTVRVLLLTIFLTQRTQRDTEFKFPCFNTFFNKMVVILLCETL